MGGGSQGGDDDLITGINVTPLVDIVLVLLIILMVTASYIVSKSIPMELPSGSTGEPTTEPRTLTVSLDEEGTLYIDAEPTTWEALPGIASRFAASFDDVEEQPRAVIAADRRVSHGDFIRIVDILREARITRYAINVNPEDVNRGSD
ncbi:MAG: ExbD/TolR family protein [Sandaracinaceae bacterium]